MSERRRFKYALGGLFLTMIMMISCKEDPIVEYNLPEIVSLEVNRITSHSAEVTGVVRNAANLECLLRLDGGEITYFPGFPSETGTVIWNLDNLQPDTDYSATLQISSSRHMTSSSPVEFKTQAKKMPPPDQVHFADNALEKYCMKVFDTDEDGYLTPDEVSQVKELTISGLGISSLEGLEVFTSLESLVCDNNALSGTLSLASVPTLLNLDCRYNNLTVLDLSRNAQTTMSVFCSPQFNGELDYLIIREGQIIDTYTSPSTKVVKVLLFKDPVFEEFCIRHYDNDGNGIITSNEVEEETDLDISKTGVTCIDEIRYFTKLRFLSAHNNDIGGTLDLSGNKMLETAQLNNNHLSEIVLDNPRLCNLGLSASPLESLDLSKVPNLQSLGISGVKADNEEINKALRDVPQLLYLQCEDCGLESLDLSGMPDLFWLDCARNNLKTLDLRNNADVIKHLCCTPQNNGEIDLLFVAPEQHVEGVTSNRWSNFVAPSTRIVRAVLFDDEYFEKYCLDNFDLDDDGLVSGEEANKVTIININGLHLSSIKGVDSFKNLELLNCQKCGLSGVLDLSKNKELICIGLSQNSLTGIILGDKPRLEQLNLYESPLTSLNLSGAPRLHSLTLSEMPYGDNINDELKKVPELEFLICDRCNLTYLDLSCIPKLTYLQCYQNYLKSLDLSYLTGYCGIYCSPQKDGEIETIYIREGQKVYGLTVERNDNMVSPTTKIIVKQ